MNGPSNQFVWWKYNVCLGKTQKGICSSATLSMVSTRTAWKTIFFCDQKIAFERIASLSAVIGRELVLFTVFFFHFNPKWCRLMLWNRSHFVGEKLRSFLSFCWASERLVYNCQKKIIVRCWSLKLSNDFVVNPQSIFLIANYTRHHKGVVYLSLGFEWVQIA